jgi:hypothetical protein
MRPWNYSKNRYIHRQVIMTVGAGFDPATGTTAATGTAAASVSIPCPGRLVSVQYGVPHATDHYGVVGNGLTNGALAIKAETVAGVNVYAESDISAELIVPTPVGTTAIAEDAAATAATDGFSGGFPIRGGVYLGITGATDAEVVQIDMWFRLCTYVKGDLVAQSGVDGAGIVLRTIKLGNAGVLAAWSLDYQNTPSTADVIVRADSTNGPILVRNHATGSQTDQAPKLIGMAGVDEAGNASAATDGTECGSAFKSALYIDVAQTDAFTSSDEKIVYELWIDD